jgi:hypothetical protein
VFEDFFFLGGSVQDRAEEERLGWTPNIMPPDLAVFCLVKLIVRGRRSAMRKAQAAAKVTGPVRADASRLNSDIWNGYVKDGLSILGRTRPVASVGVRRQCRRYIGRFVD